METKMTILTETIPSRFHSFSAVQFAMAVAGFALVWTAFNGVNFSLGTILEAGPRVSRLLSQMWPLDFSSFPNLLKQLWITFLMAICGTTLGIVISLPLVLFAARNLTPHPLVRFAVRGFISFCRTVPDLIWALIFVIVVGLGPIAGALAIMMDSIGFLGKFFSEASEEQDPGPQEGVKAMGGSNLDVAMSVVLPSALPSFISDALFATEKAVRASVILGLVGAGGIGIELKVAMDLFQYEKAALIILRIFVLVVLVEQVSNRLRTAILGAH
jgi:phosphonate transport system permease protein